MVEHFVLHLAVDAIEAALEQGQPKAIGERLAGVDRVAELRAPGVTARTGLDFGQTPLSRHLRPCLGIGSQTMSARAGNRAGTLTCGFETWALPGP